MVQNIINKLTGLWMTIISAGSVITSFTLMKLEIEMDIDPAWIAVVISGIPIVYWAVYSVIKNKGIRKITSSLLISTAMIACIYIGELFAAGEIAFIMAIGGLLEERTVARAKKGLKGLLSIMPAQGRLLKEQSEIMVAVEQIKPGDILRVLPGEVIPADGIIVTGSTSVDQSIMTGESLPVDKTCGDDVFCGTINQFGSIDIRATKIPEDSSVQRMIRLIQEADSKKAPSQRIADKWAAWLVPIALLIAIATYFISGELIRAVTVLVVFCPCALVLATPTAIVAAIGQATKHGVIVKSGEALENMGRLDCIIFDKTGTITNGNLTVSDVISFDSEISDEALLTLVASAESLSEHPLGKAVTEHAKKNGFSLLPVADFKMIPGKGISASVDGNHIICGSNTYIQENGISTDNEKAVLDRLRREGKAVIIIAMNDKCIGIAALSDTIRDTVHEVVQKLRGNKMAILTGDHRETAEYFAKKAGIQTVYAELLPEHKVGKIQEVQKSGEKVCMVGDGVNDAPALKMANVGVAMGGMGSDIAAEAADVVLMSDDISKLPYLKWLSNATVKLIKTNISLSLIINLTAVYLSINALLNPVTGALVHNAGAVLVVLNASLLYDRKYRG